MQEMGENRWVKPYFGYYPPDPNCPDCKGTGQLNKDKPIKISFECDQVWIGICPICGECNGIYYQHYDSNEEDPDEYFDKYHNGRRPRCMNEDCPNKFVSWVREKEIEE